MGNVTTLVITMDLKGPRYAIADLAVKAKGKQKRDTNPEYPSSVTVKIWY
jgi:hypothetical protein